MAVGAAERSLVASRHERVLEGVGLVGRLRSRRGEIAQGLMTRVCAISDPYEVGGVEYARGLGEAVSAALDYGLTTIDGQPQAGVPGVLVEQAKAAARSGVGLDTVLRRYLAGHTLLCDHLLLEAERIASAEDRDLRRALRTQSEQLDRLLAVVTETYTAEVAARQATIDYRRVQRVRRLLDGGLVDASELNYDLEGWHLGVVAGGPFASRAIRELAALLDRQSLIVLPGGEIAWGWLGGRDAIPDNHIRKVSIPSLESGRSVSMAVGQPAEGVDGLRLTHRQAKAAFPLAARAKGRVMRYADFATVASAWQDDVLSRSLSRMFLAPLTTERDGGESLLNTLQAYFATGRNAASAAARLQISRQTVNNRLRIIEEKIGRCLDDCGSEVETALRLWEFGHPTALEVWTRHDQPATASCHIAVESVTGKD